MQDDITAELAEVEDWEELEDHLELNYGTKKKFIRPPSAVDINRVLKFVANSTNENEKLNGGKWLNKFYEYRDKYGEREPSQRSRKAIEVKLYSILFCFL